MKIEITILINVHLFFFFDEVDFLFVDNLFDDFDNFFDDDFVDFDNLFDDFDVDFDDDCDDYVIFYDDDYIFFDDDDCLLLTETRFLFLENFLSSPKK